MSVSKFVVAEPIFTVVQREDENSPVYAAINTVLADFNEEQQQYFGWQLSLIMDLNTETETGLPDAAEAKEIEPFCTELDRLISADGNAVPLARISWKKTYELLFRVYNPVEADKVLQTLIEAEENPRPFTYTIDPDEQWEMAADYTKGFNTQPS
ncbi:hypothetical protein SIN8267_01071 [Sinobacterium norvegicum]|uniref:DUF695 domain-containing protein n=1 Tax=Sinobacterium norvegicum TaxID=1641715 RepID=A0ABN8EH00_9GAMM|nr:DUF695 domain-containing protein [Sinobacterium norvegicum]CAH0990970.1 hypothetical protein SIN8267_01071 [Sinobacterium norvegicum]